MRKILTAIFSSLLLLLLSVQPTIAAGNEGSKSTKIIEELNRELEKYQPYRMSFDVIIGNDVLTGYYEVDDEQYYISLDEQELYGNESVKFEVFNSRKEIVIDLVIPDLNGNILTNPARAFSSIRDNFNSKIVGIDATNGTITIELVAKAAAAGDEESVELVLSSSTKLPEMIIYKFGGQSIEIRLLNIVKLSSTITTFDEGNYPDYEIIDFR